MFLCVGTVGTREFILQIRNIEKIGQGVVNENCSGVNIVNEMDVPVLAMGLHDVVISASPERILVSDKEQSSYRMQDIG